MSPYGSRGHSQFFDSIENAQVGAKKMCLLPPGADVTLVCANVGLQVDFGFLEMNQPVSLMELSLDLHIHIYEFLHPLQIPAIRQISKISTLALKRSTGTL